MACDNQNMEYLSTIFEVNDSEKVLSNKIIENGLEKVIALNSIEFVDTILKMYPLSQTFYDRVISTCVSRNMYNLLTLHVKTPSFLDSCRLNVIRTAKHLLACKKISGKCKDVESGLLVALKYRATSVVCYIINNWNLNYDKVLTNYIISPSIFYDNNHNKYLKLLFAKIVDKETWIINNLNQLLKLNSSSLSTIYDMYHYTINRKPIYEVELDWYRPNNIKHIEILSKWFPDIIDDKLIVKYEFRDNIFKNLLIISGIYSLNGIPIIKYIYDCCSCLKYRRDKYKLDFLNEILNDGLCQYNLQTIEEEWWCDKPELLNLVQSYIILVKYAGKI
jgi:hypothetical protein